MAPLTLAQLQKAQAEADGFAFGPEPALNPANLYTQATAGNPQPTPPAPTPVPYYPSSETPNLHLSTRDVAAEMANNLVILDTLFSSGGGTGVPVVQAALTAVSTTVPHTITETAALTTLYAISLFMQALGTGGAGDTITVTINYVSPASPTPLTITILMHLDSANVVMETYPLLVAAGTTISMSSAYGGAYADPYTLSCKLVEMP